jgi:ABC-2 type transport system ATP-binding protein
MQEVEAVCDRVIIIKKGAILVDKKLSELKQNNKQIIEVTFDRKIEEQFFQQLSNIISLKYNSENTWSLTFESKEDKRSKIFDFAQQNSLKILSLNAQHKNLETLFKEVTS